ncbi:NAD(P)H-hydrate dehydratase [Pseudomonas sp. 5P_3.1_Bac2]|uniref:NAD(P)H-hydrate dehydratase n=1 Tax=Pseudomonas sp. 5P_3.1_Bac2 TaxID=2971617 RepID=UPI0021C58C21|nr:NAD(P)H-hydrate dehydratase [Pseudomonas sp. 5P_3.1_Bac2]MCU1718295.1 NAD(P)H-hydrate dehydratase [Pseudomonas sp. 5P_3.1_Bac2]
MPHSPEILPLALYSAAQVRELDQRLIAAGTPAFTLMQRAGEAIWQALGERWPRMRELTVLAGKGNNAGDGYVVAALAQQAGWQVQLLSVGEPAALSGSAAQARDAAVAAGVAVQPWQASSVLRGVVLDALLGTGLRGAVSQPFAQVIEALNASGLPVLAADLPSGLCADTGQVLGVAVRAELTVSLIGLKLGLFTGQAASYVGAVRLADLQADPAIVASQAYSALRLTDSNVPRLAPRSPGVHKGQLGHVLVVGGERGFAGAPMLSAQMALRAGAGLVSLATRTEHLPAVQARLPEVMGAGVASANQLLRLTQAASVLAVGPGLGQTAWSRSLLSAAAISPAAQVWDADALNLLAQGAVKLPDVAVLTPHPGEAARLLGLSTAQVQADRPAAARALAQRYQQVCLLKGAGSLIAAPDGRLWLCERGNPVMAGAGLGDVLTGLIAALLAQGLAPLAAAQLAVYVHACAGERLAVKGAGLAASDLCEVIRALLQEQLGV